MNRKIKLAMLISFGFLIKAVMSVVLDTGFDQWRILLGGAVMCLWLIGLGLMEEAQKARDEEITDETPRVPEDSPPSV